MPRQELTIRDVKQIEPHNNACKPRSSLLSETERLVSDLNVTNSSAADDGGLGQIGSVDQCEVREIRSLVEQIGIRNRGVNALRKCRSVLVFRKVHLESKVERARQRVLRKVNGRWCVVSGKATWCITSAAAKPLASLA